ncbi:hypothetical protein KQX54_006188 [Cotesia glomerata]|uniref:Uncharacterized protein n=1 Tax=Cotesia glomerata TaxID=32391 RepID=A0AAV7HPF2_COTGL|nr:hypothetical protein KQX54_006188 [Cotesia glomerata]
MMLGLLFNFLAGQQTILCPQIRSNRPLNFLLLFDGSLAKSPRFLRKRLPKRTVQKESSFFFIAKFTQPSERASEAAIDYTTEMYHRCCKKEEEVGSTRAVNSRIVRLLFIGQQGPTPRYGLCWPLATFPATAARSTHSGNGEKGGKVKRKNRREKVKLRGKIKTSVEACGKSL